MSEVISPEELAEAEDGFVARVNVWARQIEWNAEFSAWVDAQPVWTSASEWIDCEAAATLFGAPFKQPEAKSLRLRLPGGHDKDEVQLHTRFEATDKDGFTFCRRIDVRLSEFGVRTVRGREVPRLHLGVADDIRAEMRRAYINGIPARLANRLVELIRTIDSELPAGFCYGLLDRRADALSLARVLQKHRADALRCIACERPLRDPVSKSWGVGPECRKFGGR